MRRNDAMIEAGHQHCTIWFYPKSPYGCTSLITFASLFSVRTGSKFISLRCKALNWQEKNLFKNSQFISKFPPDVSGVRNGSVFWGALDFGFEHLNTTTTPHTPTYWTQNWNFAWRTVGTVETTLFTVYKKHTCIWRHILRVRMGWRRRYSIVKTSV